MHVILWGYNDVLLKCIFVMDYKQSWIDSIDILNVFVVGKFKNIYIEWIQVRHSYLQVHILPPKTLDELLMFEHSVMVWLQLVHKLLYTN